MIFVFSRGFEEICMALEELKGSIRRKVSPKLEKLIRTHYKRSIRNGTDPFKRLVLLISLFCCYILLYKIRYIF